MAHGFEDLQPLAAVIEALRDLAVFADLRKTGKNRKPAADLLQKDSVGMANEIAAFRPVFVAGKIFSTST